MYHRDFIRKFVPDLLNAISIAFSKIPKMNIRCFERKFNRNIIPHIANLLKRVYSIEKVQEEVERLTKSIILYFVESDNLNSKYEGMVVLNELIRRVHDQSALTKDHELFKWIKENNIVSLVTDSSNYNLNNIKCLRFIMSFYLLHDYMGDQEIDEFWMVPNLSFDAKLKI